MRSNSRQTVAVILSAAMLGFSADLVFAQQNSDMSAMPGMEMSKPDAPSEGASGKIGVLDLSGGYVKAMLPGQPVGGGYVTIHNGGTADDRLVSVSSAAAGKVELHEMTMAGEVMKMRELKDGIVVPAGDTVKLAPNELHMMFKQVKSPFKQGGSVPVQLTFENAGAISLTLPVTSAKGK